jgi:hypothetical protein
MTYRNPKKDKIQLSLKGYGWNCTIDLPKDDLLKRYDQARMESVVYNGRPLTIREFLVFTMAAYVHEGSASILGISSNAHRK